MTEHEKVHVICENLCLEEGMTKKQIEDNFATKTTVQSLASGSPKGTYVDAAALKTANPDTGVYIATSNGHLYSWTKNSTGNPIDLGVYQAVEVADGAINESKLSTGLKSILGIISPEYTITEGKYINVSGLINSSNNFCYSSPFQLKKHKTLVLTAKGYVPNVSIITKCDSQGENRRSLVASESNDTQRYIYTANEDMYVIISSTTANLSNVHIVDDINFIFNSVLKNTDDIDELQFFEAGVKDSLNFEVPTYEQVDGKYVNYLGTIAISNSWAMSNPIQIKKGSKISFKSQGYLESVSMITECDEQGENRNCLVKSIDNTVREYSYTANTDMYVIISYHKSSFSNLVVYIDGNTLVDDISNLDERVTELDENINDMDERVTELETFDNIKRTCGLVSNAVFCGDSLTYGQTYISDTDPKSYRNYYNYPYFVKKLMNLDSIEEYAFGGAKSDTWWNAFRNNIVSDNSIYFVWLGTNDTFTDTVATDCAGDDYTTYAETETGYYGKILGKISSLSGNKIVMLNQFANNQAKEINNKVINDLATKFNAVVIDIDSSDCRDSKYHTAYNGHYNGVHFNDKGNNYIANIVDNQLNEYLKTNSIEMYKVHQ